MRISLLIIFLFFSFVLLAKKNAWSKAFEPQEVASISKEARVSVITCKPGKEIYSVFGHTALRISDPVNHIDRVYNYGTFDFSTNNFALKFAKGDLQYFSSVNSFNNFIYLYALENRLVLEQILNLSPQQKQLLYKLIEKNINSSQKYYRYQFFSDNCTTRIYYLLVTAIGRDLKTDTSYIQRRESYREMFNPYVENFPWLRVGMNISLGLETDKKANYKETLFLPSNLESALNHSFNNKLPLVLQSSNLLSYSSNSGVNASWLTPMNTLLLLLLITIIITVLQLLYNFSFAIIDTFNFGFTGLMGCVIFLLSLLSSHTPMHNNLNILWLMPLNLILAFKTWSLNTFKLVYCKLYLFVLLILIAINMFLGLFINEFYAVSLIIMIRLSYIIWNSKHVDARKTLASLLKT